MKVNTDGVANSYLFVCAEGIRFDTDSPALTLSPLPPAPNFAAARQADQEAARALLLPVALAGGGLQSVHAWLIVVVWQGPGAHRL
eukprot:scaffold68806_cov21-Phaeocystis_antarctica.AAC.1